MKKIVVWLTGLLLCVSLCLCATANSTNPDALFLIDGADLLTENEEARLRTRLEEISQACGAQVAVGTVSQLQGTDMDSFTEYVYDSEGYGGRYEGNAGVLLLVCMDVREYRILSNGFAADAITPSDIDSISDVIVSDLSNGDYADAFFAYAEECEYYLDGYLNGFPFDAGKTLLTSLIIGIVAGVIVALILKSQLKSVRKKADANAYIKPGSMRLTQSGDYFMYRNVTRTLRETKSTSSRSSGSSRSIGGGKF